MGLLDDAIREHLDLKRRRGADPAEVERAEREALGPVRRNRDPNAAEDPEAAAADDLDPTIGSALDEPDEGVASDLVEEPYGEKELYDEEPEPSPARGDTYIEDDEQSTTRSPPRRTRASPPARTRSPTRRTPTARRSCRPSTSQPPRTPPRGTTSSGPSPQRTPALPSDHRAEQPGGEDEDVLEETPEFLQDTPDHDRLWFEQRPPRDFDFDS